MPLGLNQVIRQLPWYGSAIWHHLASGQGSRAFALSWSEPHRAPSRVSPDLTQPNWYLLASLSWPRPCTQAGLWCHPVPACRHCSTTPIVMFSGKSATFMCDCWLLTSGPTRELVKASPGASIPKVFISSIGERLVFQSLYFLVLCHCNHLSVVGGIHFFPLSMVVYISLSS